MRGRKLRINWKEEGKILQELYRKESDPETRRRLHAIWLLRQGDKISRVAWLMGVHLRTLNRWLSWYREGGIDELKARRRGNPRGRPPMLSQEQLARLEEELRKGTLTTTWEAIAWVSENFGVNYSYWGMYYLLRRIGFSRRRGVKGEGEEAGSGSEKGE